MSRPAALLIGALLLAALSIGLPWGSYGAVPGYVTIGYFAPEECSIDYEGDYECYQGNYVPGSYIPGFAGGAISGETSTARFFVAGAVALVGIGWRRRRPRMMHAGVAVAAVGIVYASRGLTGGAAALALAAALAYTASRHLGAPDDRTRAAGGG